MSLSIPVSLRWRPSLCREGWNDPPSHN
jgi:hypothetical protein